MQVRRQAGTHAHTHKLMQARRQALSVDITEADTVGNFFINILLGSARNVTESLWSNDAETGN